MSPVRRWSRRHEPSSRSGSCTRCTLLPPAGRPARAVLYESTDPDGRQLHTRRVVAIARQGDLQPAGQLPRGRARSRPPAQDARRRTRPGVARRLPHVDAAVQGPSRRRVDPAAPDRPAPHRPSPVRPRRPSLRDAASVAARRWRATRGPRPARMHRHVCERHDAARHQRATVRAGVGQPRRADGQPRPCDVVPPPVPCRRLAAVPRAIRRARRRLSFGNIFTRDGKRGDRPCKKD